jgi:hypothetical protein
MTVLRIVKRLFVLLAAVVGTQCASGAPTGIESGARPPATAFADVRLEEGTECIVRLMTGETVRGRLQRIGSDRIDLRLPDAFRGHVPRSIPHADVALLARVVKMSTTKRGWVGAAIGAAASAPFGVSMAGDMMIPAAPLGSVIARGTGDSRAVVVHERQPTSQ